MKKWFFFVLAIMVFTACNPKVYTLPKVSDSGDVVISQKLIIPEEFEVLSTDFAATMAVDKGGDGGFSSTTIGRAFIKLHCRHKVTGKDYLLIYEDLKNRSKPIQIIKFEKAPLNEILKKGMDN